MKICHKNNLNYVWIENENENNEVIDVVMKISNSLNYWIGGTDLGNPMEYWWSSFGKPIKYFMWDQNQPNSTNGNCIALSDRKSGRGVRWNVDNCLTQKFFICSKLKN